MSTTLTHPVVSKQQWLEARKTHLAHEKELTHMRDQLARERRELPWVKVDQNYVFDAPQGKVALADLFRGKSQLVIYHFMFGPDWAEGCPSCSLLADHMNGATPHLAARDTSMVMVSRAPIGKIEAFKKRMGWSFPWVSSFGNNFNHDFGVYFTKEEKAAGDGKVNYNYTIQPFPSDEAPGASVFYKDRKTGEIFHTYSTYGRGLDPFVVAYTLLDLVPKGRDEDELPFTMSWVRHHDRYEGAAASQAFADKDKPYWPKLEVASNTSSSSSSSCCHSEATK